MAGTGILGLFVAYYGDSRNQVPLYLLPPLFFALCVAIGVSYGMNAGSAINPASDFGARLFAFFAGYGTEIFTLVSCEIFNLFSILCGKCQPLDVSFWLISFRPLKRNTNGFSTFRPVGIGKNV